MQFSRISSASKATDISEQMKHHSGVEHSTKFGLICDKNVDCMHFSNILSASEANPLSVQMKQHNVLFKDKKGCHEICSENEFYSSLNSLSTSGSHGGIQQSFMRDNETYFCEICSKTFCDECSLKTHLILHRGKRAFVCPVCAKCFAQKGNLTVHLRTHTGECPYQCNICNKNFNHSSNLSRHYQAHRK
ncbi:zinc finger protein 2-like isoform X2 [Stegodyphus dumicola]|nr:zinc finger protein 2-like isoform X2 [Stegodyphus dumicola]XP_035204973.1 zinc finger protein 2-like isoform X2 [Stegodyphus dumicola]XP_035204979.1 zinc finger protein 2-like isoform X2 [Stegodyphus dumicola]